MEGSYKELREELKRQLNDILTSKVDVFDEIDNGNETIRSVIKLEVIEFLKNEVQYFGRLASAIKDMNEETESPYWTGRLETILEMKFRYENFILHFLGFKTVWDATDDKAFELFQAFDEEKTND